MQANPWLKLLDNPPYVLDVDKPYIDAFNEFHKSRGDHWVNLLHPPEPRLGPVTAPVMILQLNPSYSSWEFEGPKNKERLQRDLISLKDEKCNHLGVTLKDHWWKPRLKQLDSELGSNLLEKNICSVEFFPYRSRRFAHGQVRLPSQEYTFSLVKNALEQKALIIVARNLQLWTSAVPELQAYLGKSVITLNNPRSLYFSRKNMPTDDYDRILEAIRQ